MGQEPCHQAEDPSDGSCHDVFCLGTRRAVAGICLGRPAQELLEWPHSMIGEIGFTEHQPELCAKAAGREHGRRTTSHDERGILPLQKITRIDPDHHATCCRGEEHVQERARGRGDAS